MIVRGIVWNVNVKISESNILIKFTFAFAQIKKNSKINPNKIKRGREINRQIDKELYSSDCT